MIVFLNGHAGAGLGGILIAIAILALSATVAIFIAINRSHPSVWLHRLGAFFVVSLIAQLILSFALFPALLLLTFWFLMFGFVIAGVLGLVSLASGPRPS